MRRNIKRKKLYIYKSIRVGLIAAFIALAAAVPGAAYLIDKNNKYENKKVDVYSYTNNASVDYNVFLIPNQLYTQRCLDKGKVYVADLIDYIDTSFKYEFKGERPADIKGKYSITAILSGFTKGFNDNKCLWQKEYVLQPDIEFSGNDNRISIEKQQPVYIKSYANYIKMALDTIKINFDTNIVIKWNVSFEIKTDKGVVSEKLAPTMVIPLSGQLIEITGGLTDQKNGALTEMQLQLSPYYEHKILACWIIEGITVVSILFLLIFTAPLSLSSRQKQQKHIFKNYECRMVAMDSDIIINNRKTMRVSSISDLLKIADDMSNPILYKNSENIEDITKFYVITDQTIYLLDISKTALTDDNILSKNFSTDKNEECLFGEL